MDPIHESDSGMQSLLHDIFSIHDIRVNEGGSQMGVEADNVQHDEECCYTQITEMEIEQENGNGMEEM
jgi:hypothetical protein